MKNVFYHVIFNFFLFPNKDHGFTQNIVAFVSLIKSIWGQFSLKVYWVHPVQWWFKMYTIHSSCLMKCISNPWFLKIIRFSSLHWIGNDTFFFSWNQVSILMASPMIYYNHLSIHNLIIGDKERLCFNTWPRSSTSSPKQIASKVNEHLLVLRPIKSFLSPNISRAWNYLEEVS